MNKIIKFILNGKQTSIKVDGERMLLWVLRTDLGLTGTKYGCGEGICGSCTVLIDGDAVRSCQISIKEVEGKSVTTIEGLENNGKLHPVQKAFIDNDALQCGYCTPGMIMNAVALLNKKPDLSEKEIIEGMEDNLCRCGAHKRIVSAVKDASNAIGGKK